MPLISEGLPSVFSFLSLQALDEHTLTAPSAICRKKTFIISIALVFICFLFPAPLDQPEIWGSFQPNSTESPKLQRPFPIGSKLAKKQTRVYIHEPKPSVVAAGSR